MFKKVIFSMMVFALSSTINLASLESGADIYATGSDAIQATELTIIDGESKTEVTDFPYSLKGLSEKSYTLKSGDKTFTLHVDNTAPKISTNIEDKTYQKAEVKIDTDAEDVEITLNGEKKKSSFTVEENGEYKLVVTAKDKAGNKASLERKFKVYNTAPVIKITGIEKKLQNKDYNISVKVESDFDTKTDIKLDGERVSPEITVSKEGTHTLSVETEDELGNKSMKTRTFMLDKSSPEITVEGIDKTSYNTDVTYKVTGADKIYINDAEVAAEGTLTEDGSYILKATATNDAGTTTEVIKKFKINKSAPDITITGLDKALYNTDVSYSVTSETGTVSVKINDAESEASGTVSDEGTYKLIAEAKDGEKVTTEERSFTIDKTSPEITITGVQDGYYYNEDVTYSVSSTDSVNVKLDGKEVAPGTVSDEGEHVLEVNSEDAAGNKSTKTVRFTIDKTAPVISYNDAEFVKDLKMVKAVISEKNLTSVSMKAVCAEKMFSASTTSAEIGLSEDDSASAENDKWEFTVSAIDKAGNKAELTKTVTRDTVAPVITLPEVKKFINQDVDFEAAVSDANEGESVMTIARGNSNEEVRPPLRQLLSKEGKYEIKVTSTDKAGNTSSEKTSFTIDKTKPVVSLSTSEGHVQSAKEAEVSINEDGTSYMKVVRDGKTVFEDKADKYSNFSKNGVYKITAYAIDKAGNRSNDVTKTFTVDNIRPKISLTGAKQGAYYNKAVTLTATVNERFYKDTKVTISGRVEKHGGISFPFKCKGKKTKLSKTFSTNGIYHVKMTATDKAGNTASTKELVFTVDTVKPTIKISAPSNAGYDAIVAPKVEIKDDFFKDKSISITGDRKSYKDSFGKTGGTRSYANFAKVRENDGIYTLSVRAIDLAGNVSTSSQTFTVNRFGSTFKVKKTPSEYEKDADSNVVIDETNISGIKDYKCIVRRDAEEFEAADVTTKDRGTTRTYTIPKSNFDKEGVYKVYVESLDGTGNTSRSKADFSFTVDRTPPVIVYTGIQSGKAYKVDSVNLNVSATDTLSKDVTLKVSANGRDAKIQEGSEGKYAVIGKGYNQKLTITATDKAGNTASKTLEKVSISASKFSFFAMHKGLTAAGIVLIAMLGTAGGVLALRKKKEDKGDDIVI